MDARSHHEKHLEQATPAESSNNNNNNNENDNNPLAEWLTKPIEETYSDKVLERVLKTISATAYEKRLTDSNAASKLIGNTYTASVFLGLASLIDRAGSRGDLTPGKTIGMFSYGSGALATMYLLTM